jgi:hypothetical protein
MQCAGSTFEAVQRGLGRVVLWGAGVGDVCAVQHSVRVHHHGLGRRSGSHQRRQAPQAGQLPRGSPPRPDAAVLGRLRAAAELLRAHPCRSPAAARRAAGGRAVCLCRLPRAARLHDPGALRPLLPLRAMRRALQAASGLPAVLQAHQPGHAHLQPLIGRQGKQREQKEKKERRKKEDEEKEEKGKNV